MIPSLKSSENTAFCGVGVVKRPAGGIKECAAVFFLMRGEGSLPCCFAHCIPLFAMHSRIFSPPGVPMQDTARHIPSLPYNHARLLRSRPPLNNRARLLQYRPLFTFRKISYNHTYFLTFMHLSLQINIFLTNSIFSYYSQFLFTTRKFLYQCVYPFTFPQAQPPHSPQGASPDPRVRHRAQAQPPHAQAPTPAFAAWRDARPPRSPHDATPNPRVRRMAQPPTPALTTGRKPVDSAPAAQAAPSLTHSCPAAYIYGA